MKQRWHVHCCALSKECRPYVGLLWRAHLNTPWFHLGVAFTPSARFAWINKRARWTDFRYYGKEPDDEAQDA